MSEAAEQIDTDVESTVAQPVTLTEAPAETPPEPYRPAFSEQDQAFINDKIVGPKVAKQREAERELETVKADLAEARSKIPEQKRPEVPGIPDAFDDDYEAKITVRDEAIRSAAAFDATAKASADHQASLQQQQNQDAQDAMVKSVTDYTDRSNKLGIPPVEIQAAGAIVEQGGLSDPVIGYILDLDQGPAVTVYLSKNPQVLDELAHMSPMDAAVRISGDIKAAAVLVKRGGELTPEPTETLRGAGFPEGERGPNGATFE